MDGLLRHESSKAEIPDSRFQIPDQRSRFSMPLLKKFEMQEFW
jgi:hypothetical protein